MTNRSTAETVAIIGAGIGGCYLVAELGIAGFKLRLHDIDDSKLSEIRARGGIQVEGERAGFAAVERATTDLGSAVDGADVIIGSRPSPRCFCLSRPSPCVELSWKHREDPCTGTRPRPDVLRSPGRHRRRSHPPRPCGPIVQPTERLGNPRYDPDARCIGGGEQAGRGARRRS